MSPTFSHEGDGALTNSLAGIVCNLRSRRYADLHGDAQAALRGACEEFIRLLAEHLEQEEGVLLPVLLQADPSAAPEIDLFREEHRLLHLCARNLALCVRARDEEGACEIGRSFLAMLMNHVERESKTVNRIVQTLPPATLKRLAACLSAHESRNLRPKCTR